MDLVTLALAKKYTNQKVNDILSFGGFEIVESLPTSDISHSTVYLLKSSEEARNIYTEYIYTKNNEWESLGTTVDLNGYITEENLQEAINIALAQAKDSGEFKPVKGEDYWTEDDKQEIIDEVVAEMPEGGAEGLVYEEFGGDLPRELDQFSFTKVFKFNNAYYALLGQSKDDFVTGRDWNNYENGYTARLTDQYLYSTDGLNWTIKSFERQGNWIDYCIIDDKLYVLDGSYHNQWWNSYEDEITGEWIEEEHHYYSRPNTILVTDNGETWSRIALPSEARYTCIDANLIDGQPTIFVGGHQGELLKMTISQDDNSDLITTFNELPLDQEYPILDLAVSRPLTMYEHDRPFEADVVYFYTQEQKLYGYDLGYGDREPVLFECGSLPMQNVYRIEAISPSGYQEPERLCLLGETGWFYGALYDTTGLTIYDGLLHQKPEYYNWEVTSSFSTPYCWNGHLFWDDNWYEVRYYFYLGAERYNCTYEIDANHNDQYITRGSLWSYRYDGGWWQELHLFQGDDDMMGDYAGWVKTLRFIYQNDEDISPDVAEALWPHLTTKVNTLIPTIHPNTLQSKTKAIDNPIGHLKITYCYNKKLHRIACGSTFQESSYSVPSISISDDEGLSWSVSDHEVPGYLLGAGANVFILDGSERTREEVYDEIEGTYQVIINLINNKFLATTLEPDSPAIECQFSEELPLQEYSFASGSNETKECLLLYGTGAIAHSEDGITWTVVKDTFPFTNNAKLIYCKDRFIAWENNQLASSTDGITWELIRTLDADVNDIFWAFGKLFVYSRQYIDNLYTLVLSLSEDQGSTWTDLPLDESSRVPNTFAFGRFYYAEGWTGTYESFDGIHWEKSSAPNINNDPTCEYQRFFTISEQSLIYGVGYSGYPFFYQTTDGQHWVESHYAIMNYDEANITKAVSTAISQQLYHNYTVSVSPNEWNSEKQWICALGAGRVNNNSLVLVAAHPRTRKPYIAANVQCIDQGEGTLTFECATIPSDTILINLTIFGQHEITIPYLSEEV